MIPHKILLTLCLSLCFGSLFFANSAGAADFKYEGVKNCKKCHQKEDVGAQYKKWESLKHSHAYKNLSSPEALKLATNLGLKSKPDQSAECLVCHTTAFGEDPKLLKKGFDVTDGVQCESCHGPGDKYGSKKVFKELSELKTALFKTPGDAGLMAKIKTERANLAKLGLIQPDEKLCRTCHAPEIKFQGKTYKNPTWDPAKGFDYQERLKKIAHPRTEY